MCVMLHVSQAHVSAGSFIQSRGPSDSTLGSNSDADLETSLRMASGDGTVDFSQLGTSQASDHASVQPSRPAAAVEHDPDDFMASFGSIYDEDDETAGGIDVSLRELHEGPVHHTTAAAESPTASGTHTDLDGWHEEVSLELEAMRAELKAEQLLPPTGPSVPVVSSTPPAPRTASSAAAQLPLDASISFSDSMLQGALSLLNGEVPPVPPPAASSRPPSHPTSARPASNSTTNSAEPNTVSTGVVVAQVLEEMIAETSVLDHSEDGDVDLAFPVHRTTDAPPLGVFAFDFLFLLLNCAGRLYYNDPRSDRRRGRGCFDVLWQDFVMT
jgi:hypothetical protein